MIAGWDVGASRGALFDDGRQLSELIGRPTTSLSAAVAHALNQAPLAGPETRRLDVTDDTCPGAPYNQN